METGDDRGRGIGEVARDDVASDGQPGLLTDSERLSLADGRDAAADERDTVAERRDAVADERDKIATARDVHAEIRDAAVADQPDPAGSRRFAAQDRESAAGDREASADVRHGARDDRLASRWDRTVAEQIKAQLLFALDDADTLPEAILLIGRAQTMLVDTFGGTASEALIEIADRADRDQVGMQEASRQIVSEGAPSGINGIRSPVL
jgi:hypothetical protein